MYDAGTIEMRGQKFPLTVDDRGRWRAELGGQPVYGDTRAQLAATLQRLTKQASVSVSVPFVSRQGLRVQRGVATGTHAGTSNVLVRWADGRRGQIDRWGKGAGIILGDLTPEQATEWATLAKAVEDAERALAAFERTHAVDLKATVAAAVDAAIARPPLAGRADR